MSVNKESKSCAPIKDLNKKMFSQFKDLTALGKQGKMEFNCLT